MESSSRWPWKLGGATLRPRQAEAGEIILQAVCLEALPGSSVRWSACVCLASLPRHIAERQLALAGQRFGLSPEHCTVEEHADAFGPGNTLHFVAASETYANVFTGFGAPRVRSEQVTADAAGQAEIFRASGAALPPPSPQSLHQ